MDNIVATPTALEPCHYRVDLTIPAATVASATAKVEREYLSHASVPGFRAGKTPQRLLRKRFASRIRESVRDELIREGLREVTANEDLAPITMPTFVEGARGEIEEGQPFSFSVEFDVEPRFELPEYKGLDLERPTHEVEDQQVNDYLEHLRQQRASYGPVDRPATRGDLLKVSYQAELDDAVPEDARRLVTAEENWVILDEPEMLPGIVEALDGVSAGDQRDITITFPDDFHTGFLAGRELAYHVAVIEVQGSQLPELDDAFAKTVGADDVASLRDTLRERMEEHLAEMQQNYLEHQAQEKLAEQLDFPLPPQQLEQEREQELRRLLQQRYQQAMQGGADIQSLDFESMRQEVQDEAGPAAVRNLRLRYALDKIAEAEEIAVEAVAVAAAVQRFASNLRLSPAQFEREYDADMVAAHCRGDLRRQGAIERIVELARVRDVQLEEPAAEADDAAAHQSEDNGAASRPAEEDNKE